MSENAEQLIDEYLAQLKAEGRSSPAGKYWHNYFKRITRGFEQTDLPGNPLILGGSAASDQVKQERLREQLVWAHQKGRLDEAMNLLKSIPYDHWNIGKPEDWHKHFFPLGEDIEE